jgi:hypothetical protein
MRQHVCSWQKRTRIVIARCAGIAKLDAGVDAIAAPDQSAGVRPFRNKRRQPAVADPDAAGDHGVCFAGPCLHLAQPDVRPQTRWSGFDPNRTTLIG